MRSSLRDCVASIAARVAGNPVGTHLYDESRKEFVCVLGDVNGNEVDVHDEYRRVVLTGKLPELVEKISNNRVILNLEGRKLNGYDSLSQHRFQGSANRGGVWIWDLEHKKWFNYEVSFTAEFPDPFEDRSALVEQAFQAAQLRIEPPRDTMEKAFEAAQKKVRALRLKSRG